MIRLVWTRLHAFLFDPKVAAASLRSFLTFIASVVGIVIASASDATGGVNAEIIKSWDWKAWAIRIAAAMFLAGAARIRAGDKNLPIPEPAKGATP